VTPDAEGELYAIFDADPTHIIKFIQWLADQHKLAERLDVLDIGSGTGRILGAYQRLGWNVTGIEPDVDFYNKAVEYAQSLPSVVVKNIGFLEIVEKECYDLITTINDPFSYLLEIRQRVNALYRIYEALRPGGVVFLEIKNFLFKLRHYEEFTEEILNVDDQKVAHLMQHEIDFHHGYWIHRDEFLIEGTSQMVSKTHTVAIIPLMELMYFMEEQGFVNIQTYNDYDAREPQTLTGRLMLISAQKPSSP